LKDTGDPIGDLPLYRKDFYGNDRDYGDNLSTRLTFFLVGAGVGAVLALLFAPKSGEELRNDIADATRKGIDKSRKPPSKSAREQPNTTMLRAPGRVNIMNPHARRRESM